ncbi:MAG: hypothetical protein J6V99_06715 [Neisseriaceae bacterium]|nr:hypothetical protein [Neisseriaceae bacterium]
MPVWIKNDEEDIFRQPEKIHHNILKNNQTFEMTYIFRQPENQNSKYSIVGSCYEFLKSFTNIYE